MGRLSDTLNHAGRSIRSRILTGIVAIVPLLVTIWIILFVFNLLDGWLRPLALRVFGRHIPGVGLLATILLLYLFGLIVTNLGGRTIVTWTERLILKLPVIGEVYGSSKQIMEAVSNPRGFGFKRVVSFDFPRPGVRAIGFVTREVLSRDGVRHYTVFMPTAPNPTTGFVLILPASDVEDTGLVVEEAVKMLVSAGSVVPFHFRPGPPAPVDGKGTDTSSSDRPS